VEIDGETHLATRRDSTWRIDGAPRLPARRTGAKLRFSPRMAPLPSPPLILWRVTAQRWAMAARPFRQCRARLNRYVLCPGRPSPQATGCAYWRR
jgi:hypothetical protein